MSSPRADAYPARRKSRLASAARLAGAFEALVTMDGNMVHQQNIARFAIAVIALRAKSNRLDDTRPLMKPLLALLPNSNPGTLTFLPKS